LFVRLRLWDRTKKIFIS